MPLWFLFALFGTRRLPTFSGAQYKWLMSVIQQTSLSLSFGTDEKTEEWEVPERSDVWLRLDTAQQKGFHVVLRLPRASRALCSFCQGNSRKVDNPPTSPEKDDRGCWFRLAVFSPASLSPRHSYRDTDRSERRENNLFSPSPPSPETGEKAMCSQWHIHPCI